MSALLSRPLQHTAEAIPSTQNLDEILARETQLEEAEVDRSMRIPVLLFFGSAITWLLGGGVLLLISSIKLHRPNFLASYGFTTYGRIQPAGINAWLYGWLSSAGIGIGLWLMARLSKSQLRHGGLLTAAWGLWNIAVTLGTFEILNGEGTSFTWLDYPRYIAPVLFTSYIFIAVWVLMMLLFRKHSRFYISQSYVLTAFLWFPWAYATANLFMLFLPVQASAQPPVNAWFVQNLYGLWFTPIALAAAYYLIPKIIGKPIHNYLYSSLGFWTLVFLSGWRGGQNLVDGPVPAWMVSVGIGAAILFIIPLVVISNNLVGTVRGHDETLRWSPTLRFTYVGLIGFISAGAIGILLANRTINRALHFTQFETAWMYLALHGFLAMIFFGAIYYITPRLTGWDWASDQLIRGHFWLSVAGTVGIVTVLGIAGILQGYGLNDPQVPVSATVQTIVPLFVMQSVGLGILGLAHVFFATSFVLNIGKLGGRLLFRAAPATALDLETASVARSVLSKPF